MLSPTQPKPSRFDDLGQWLAWQKQLHPRVIDLGLDRVQEVLRRMDLECPPFKVISVAGTNGKGSCVAFLEAMLRAGGYRVGAYTSPHLMRYNERVRVGGREVDDTTLCGAFACVDAARDDVSLTYFEFGTLAALEIFRQARIHVAILEVGLGGRLDAVNGVESDAAIVTSIGVDHVEWLGADRESIGFEKAGIYRGGRPAVCAEPEPPRSVLEHARSIDANLYLIDRDFKFQREKEGWCWCTPSTQLQPLPLPALAGEHQLRNAAAAIMALNALNDHLPLALDAIIEGLLKVRALGRFQVIPGPVEWIFDVAHNTQGAMALAQCLREHVCSGVTRAVVGMLAGKDAPGVSLVLAPLVDMWHTAGLTGARGRSGEALARELGKSAIENVVSHDSVSAALRGALGEATEGDRIIVFGSFQTVVEALKLGLHDKHKGT